MFRIYVNGGSHVKGFNFIAFLIQYLLNDPFMTTLKQMEQFWIDGVLSSVEVREEFGINEVSLVN